MKTSIAMLSLLLSCAWAGHAQAMSKDEYKLEKTRIATDYKAARGKCAPLLANARDICQAEAKGVEKVAKAELEAKYKLSRDEEKIKAAKASAAYEVAKQKCDDLDTKAKGICLSEARAARASAKGSS